MNIKYETAMLDLQNAEDGPKSTANNRVSTGTQSTSPEGPDSSQPEKSKTAAVR